MVVMRVLVTDDSENSAKAKRVLVAARIEFTEMNVENIWRDDLKTPTLITPEGIFEGWTSVEMYSRVEAKGFHKTIMSARA